MPPVTDPKINAYGEKINVGVVGVKDFSSKYLKEGGMWPSKQGQQPSNSTIDYSQRQSIDLRQSMASNKGHVQILSTTHHVKTSRDYQEAETRIKPYQQIQSFKQTGYGGNMTERGGDYSKPMMHKHSLSISRTIDLVPLSLGGGGGHSVSQSQTSLYPALPDMSIV